jgi:hypothetical protein
MDIDPMRSVTKLSISAAAFAMMATLAPAAHAGLVDWTLDGVTFSDGGVATGTFTTDDTSGRIQSWDILTTGGSLAPETYDSDLSGPFLGAVQTRGFVVFANDGSGQRLIFTAHSPFLTTNDPDALNTTSGNSLESLGGTTRLVTAGDVAVVVDAPEPMSIAVLGTGLLGLTVSRHRRRG